MAEILIEKLEVATDYYEILDVGRRATEKEIKVSYRKKALLLHPDRCQLPKAKDAFQKLNNAYMCLSDEQKRRRYDVSGSDVDTPNPFAGGGAQNPFAGGFPGGGGFGGGIPPEIFEQLFGAAARGGGGGMPAFHFSTADGFSGFTFNQPRRRGQPRRAGAQQQQQQQQQQQGRRQPPGMPTELPASIRNSWMYRGWSSLQDVAPPAVLQMVTFSLIMLLFIVGVSLLARHFWFFVFFSMMRTFGGGIYSLIPGVLLVMRASQDGLNPVIASMLVYTFAGKVLAKYPPLLQTVEVGAIICVVIFTLLGW